MFSTEKHVGPDVLDLEEFVYRKRIGQCPPDLPGHGALFETAARSPMQRAVSIATFFNEMLNGLNQGGILA